MTDMADWAISIIKVGYERPLDDEEQRELVVQIKGYLADANRNGMELEAAKTSLMNEILDIAPVIEPFHRVLKRVLRDQKST